MRAVAPPLSGAARGATVAALASVDTAAEQVARHAYGRLLAWLAWQWRDVAAAEDALSDALLKALEHWPKSGVPDAPEAWLLTVAKRQLLQVARHDRLAVDPAVTVLLEQQELGEAAPDIPDARLKLLFVCAHPDIDEKVRVPLMLQTVLGLQVAEFAPALLMSPAALSQRLVRAKQRIRTAGLRFEEPERRELPARVQHVLESIYGAFGLAIEAIDGAEGRVSELQQEAIYLCTVVCELLPGSAEAQGLLALMLFCRARRAAQVGPDGQFVPLAEQDVALWDRPLIERAERILWDASKLHQLGPFQLEAAVQSAHCQRLFSGSTPWPAIAALYLEINRQFATAGALVAGAVAVAEAGDSETGLLQLQGMDHKAMRTFQPWWVARAHLLDLSGRPDEARVALATAIGLSTQPLIRQHLERRRAAIRSDRHP